MVSIQVRLTLLFVVIVTLVLGISGSYTQYTLSQELESGSARLRSGVLTRLQTSLPSALWDLDKSKVDSIVAAEMLPPELVGIRDDARFLEARRDRLRRCALLHHHKPRLAVLAGRACRRVLPIQPEPAAAGDNGAKHDKCEQKTNELAQAENSLTCVCQS